jgi:hypothetical protein
VQHSATVLFSTRPERYPRLLVQDDGQRKAPCSRRLRTRLGAIVGKKQNIRECADRTDNDNCECTYNKCRHAGNLRRPYGNVAIHSALNLSALEHSAGLERTANGAILPSRFLPMERDHAERGGHTSSSTQETEGTGTARGYSVLTQSYAHHRNSNWRRAWNVLGELFETAIKFEAGIYDNKFEAERDFRKLAEAACARLSGDSQMN